MDYKPSIYNTSTPNPDYLPLKKSKIYYNCPECYSLIDIISINENNNTIEFKCTQNHKEIISIKEFLTNMDEIRNTKINKDICDIHEEKFINFCFNCNKHLCKECLKTRKHLHHDKNSIIEIQPNNSEIKAINEIKNYYETKLKNLENKKINIRKELNDILNERKKNINDIIKDKIKDNKLKNENELNINKNEYLSNIEKIKNKYENDIKQIKNKYLINEKIINNKYQLRKENIEILYKYKMEQLEKKYKEILNKNSLDKEIENITNINKLNDLVYETYNSYKNNYYNSKNIINIIMHFHKNNKYIRENIKKKLSENEYNIMLNSLFEIKTAQNFFENNKENNKEIFELKKDIIENEKLKLILEQELSDMKIKLDKIKINYEKKIQKIKNENDISKLLINNSKQNVTKEYDNGRYIGNIINNKREGLGIFFYTEGKRYEGEWKDDKINGRGIMIYKIGDKYEGYFKDEKKEGKGIYYYNNGNVYEGDWKNDKKHGKGIFYGKDKRRMGDYFNGVPIGKHVFLTNNGEVEIKDENNIYNNNK